MGDLGSGLRLLGRGRLRREGKCLGFGVWTVGWTKWSRGRVGDLGSRLRLLSTRAFEKGGQVLGVDMVVSGPRGRVVTPKPKKIQYSPLNQLKTI